MRLVLGRSLVPSCLLARWVGFQQGGRPSGNSPLCLGVSRRQAPGGAKQRTRLVLVSTPDPSDRSLHRPGHGTQNGFPRAGAVDPWEVLQLPRYDQRSASLAFGVCPKHKELLGEGPQASEKPPETEPGRSCLFSLALKSLASENAKELHVASAQAAGSRRVCTSLATEHFGIPVSSRWHL